MSIQLDDARMLLKEFNTQNMQLCRQVDDSQSAIDRIKNADEDKSNDKYMKLESKVWKVL
jgi:hypothetical protein